MAHSQNDFITWGKLIGGTGGKEFWAHDQFQGVQQIEVWDDGNNLRGLRLTFNKASNTWQYGTLDGSYSSFTFQDKEYIVEATLGYSGYDNGRCGFISFATNQGRQWGSGNPNDELIRFSSCGTLVGLYGRCGSRIDQLGLIFCKPIKSLSLTKLQYDTSQLDINTTQKNILIVSRGVLENNTSMPAKKTITLTGSYSQTSTYSHQTSIHYGIKYSVEGGLIFAKDKLEIAVDASWTWTWGETTQQTLTVSDTTSIDVPPHESYGVSCTLTEVGPILIPYTATANLEYEDGTTDTWPDFEGTFSAVRGFNQHSTIERLTISSFSPNMLENLHRGKAD